jgi:MFS family permease
LVHIQVSRPQKSGKPRLFYGYIVVGAAIGIQIMAWGLYNSYGVYFNQILAEFNWPRETISGAFSLAQLVIGIGAIFLGSLNDRFGPRVLMTFGGIMAGIGFVLMSQVHSVWQIYLFQGVIAGIGLAGTDVVLLSTVARWFVKRRGIMSGIVKTGTGIGIMVVPIISAWLISLYEWRNTLIILGTTLFIVVIAGAQLLRRDPAQMKLFPDGAERAQPGVVPMSEAGLTLSQAGRTRRFWMLCGAYFMVFFISNTVIVHVAPFAVDLKLDASFAAAMVSVIGGASIAGRLMMGFVSDKIGSRRTLLICFSIFIAAFAWLQAVNSAWALALFTLVYGFAHGGFYAIMSPVVAEFFGTRAHGTIFGIVIFIASVGGAIGPILTGRIFDKTASYQAAFVILLVLVVTGFIMVFFSGPVKNKAAVRFDGYG